MELPSALPPTADLPACWTPTDQRIMEHLLLDQPTNADDAAHQDARNSPRTVELSRAEEKTPKQSATTRSGNPLKQVGSGDKAKKVEEDRRARHREVQRRFIQRKKADVERTKALAQTLEHKYRYLEISAEERNLKGENRELQGRVDAAASSVPRVPHVDPVQLLMQNQMELVKEFYEPITTQVLASVQHNAQHEYELSRRDDSFKTTGASVMGWSDFRKVEESSIKFVLSKGFPNVRALHLMNFTWDTLSTPATYGRFFSPAFPIKMQVLQVISRDALVIHRVLFNPHTQCSSNSLELLWRARIGDEYVILDTALQHNAVQQCLGASYKWTQMTTSLGFATLDVIHDSGCVLRHGGWLRTSITNVNYWFMEMFFMALRFESTMVAPVFALPSESEE
ncbi:hypothetical protein PHYPSEUDO_012795 [Phytophthora pseudosyringae]|uniref:BZIP domain-containing protein n=1 Tax=Phytophthora pseudosyringae TaxID=221518 RepID=A0A8T1V635_9STRA|nr:hypothetical protein PHYPSEUDO_012795 [Phytophthora pseudosyringae]